MSVTTHIHTIYMHKYTMVCIELNPEKQQKRTANFFLKAIANQMISGNSTDAYHVWFDKVELQ